MRNLQPLPAPQCFRRSTGQPHAVCLATASFPRPPPLTRPPAAQLTSGVRRCARLGWMRYNKIMNAEVKQAALELVERATAAGLTGSVADSAEIEQVTQDLGGKLPNWYAELISAFPLCGLDLGWQDEDDTSWMIWSTPKQLRSESLEAYPGLAILERGYINVALCAHGSGDPYFIPTDKGDNPPLYQVYHDVSDKPDEIIAEGLQLVSASLSEFFRTATVQ